MVPPLLWLEPGQHFGFDELVCWQGRGRQAFAAAAGRIDTIVLGPHASAAFPAELRPFVAPALTLRKQCDFSDRVTDDLGRAWVQADPHVVYVRNPVSRLVLDPNRAPPADPMGGLREFHARLARQRAGEKVGFGGVDAVRPITFGGEDVLPAPTSEAGWRALGAALADAASRTVQAYRGCCDEVVQAVLAARDPAAPLRVVSLHDTMNTKMRADGAIVVERPEADRLPPWANLGNKGNERGDAQDDPITLDGAELRRIAAAWADAFGLQGAARRTGILLNRPYKGAYETVHHGARLRALGRPRVGALQVEFLRETLLGPAAVAHLHAPGDDWPAADTAHLGQVAAALARAGQALRAAG
jgi:hypothetical protein